MLQQWSLYDVIEDILPFVLNTKRSLCDIWLLRYRFKDDTKKTKNKQSYGQSIFDPSHSLIFVISELVNISNQTPPPGMMLYWNIKIEYCWSFYDPLDPETNVANLLSNLSKSAHLHLLCYLKGLSSQIVQSGLICPFSCICGIIQYIQYTGYLWYYSECLLMKASKVLAWYYISSEGSYELK